MQPDIFTAILSLMAIDGSEAITKAVFAFAAAGVLVGSLFGAFILSVALSGKSMQSGWKFMSDRLSNIGNKASNAFIKQPTKEFMAEQRGKAAGRYDSTDKSWKGRARNIAARAGANAWLPTSGSRRKMAAYGLKTVSDIEQQADAALLMSGASDRDSLRAIANAGSVRGISGKGKGNPYAAAATKRLIDMADVEGLKDLAANPNADQGMVASKISANFPAVKAAHAGLAFLSGEKDAAGRAGAYLGQGPTTIAKIDELSRREIPNLSPEAAAKQSPASWQDAVVAKELDPQTGKMKAKIDADGNFVLRPDITPAIAEIARQVNAHPAVIQFAKPDVGKVVAQIQGVPAGTGSATLPPATLQAAAAAGATAALGLAGDSGGSRYTNVNIVNRTEGMSPGAIAAMTADQLRGFVAGGALSTDDINKILSATVTSARTNNDIARVRADLLDSRSRRPGQAPGGGFNIPHNNPPTNPPAPAP